MSTKNVYKNANIHILWEELLKAPKENAKEPVVLEQEWPHQAAELFCLVDALKVAKN